ncbi:sigma-70 family RNA polymerase sigma factor [Pseudoflavitalea sp. G-6-1-2]|uniref:RNA polymerase sigma factor n=1 Tax=Pseudoflavitalea sp. G-6-1-2 TaxID=2728841 RepID=UPI00146E1FC3|nr:sigma-70 family RNA polymerase sigma factor [Pseudoflavitalea sp. G-6-1-2]NML23863.1 sigma-70 family RNA polymerase sigma factor [Pseudoflavitalea sp. G-6-1-2]
MQFFSDQELWNRVTNNDSAAFAILFGQYWEEMFSLAWRRTGDEDHAKDIVQNIFIRCWEYRQEITVTDSLAPYLMTALKYSVIRHIYQSAKKGLAPLPLSVYDIPEEEKSFLQDWEEFQHVQQLIQQEVLNMPNRMQEVFRLHREQQLPVKAIALRLSISEQTVKNTLHNAITRLRTRLKSVDATWVLFI